MIPFLIFAYVLVGIGVATLLLHFTKNEHRIVLLLLGAIWPITLIVTLLLCLDRLFYSYQIKNLKKKLKVGKLVTICKGYKKDRGEG